MHMFNLSLNEKPLQKTSICIANNNVIVQILE